MGYQLWASPVTGYRRRGTRLPEIRALFESGITIHAISEPLVSCSRNAPADEMRFLLESRDFDVAGVQAKPDEPVHEFITRESLISGHVADHVQPIGPAMLIADSTPLAELFLILRTKPYTFVLRGATVNGIVTRADLNKPPVRIFMFGLISLFEMHMRYWISDMYGPNNWERHLTEKRIEAAQNFHKERKRNNQDLDLIDCLQFADKRDLILASNELREILGIRSKGSGHAILRHAESLRNNLAHSQHDLSYGMTWDELITTISSIEDMLARSDRLIEDRSTAVASSQHH